MDWKENISFILVEPREPGNIGASARAIKNMGFQHLEMVNPVPFETDETRWMSRNAYDIVKQAPVWDSFEDALGDKSIIVGTSRRRGKTRGITLTVQECVQEILPKTYQNKVAFLFGREDRGLTNREVDHCGYLMTIPSHEAQPSLNLAQAVLIVAYELSKLTTESTIDRLVSRHDLIPLYDRIRKILTMLEYIPRGDRNIKEKIMQNIQHILGRTSLADWELNLLHGICTQIELNFGRKDKIAKQ